MSENTPALVLQTPDIQNCSDMAKVAIKYAGIQCHLLW